MSGMMKDKKGREVKVGDKISRDGCPEWKPFTITSIEFNHVKVVDWKGGEGVVHQKSLRTVWTKVMGEEKPVFLPDDKCPCCGTEGEWIAGAMKCPKCWKIW